MLYYVHEPIWGHLKKLNHWYNSFTKEENRWTYKSLKEYKTFTSNFETEKLHKVLLLEIT